MENAAPNSELSQSLPAEHTVQQARNLSTQSSQQIINFGFYLLIH